MNVTLPNGTLITDVPDDITQKELARIAINNDLAVASDFGDLFDETTALGALGEAGKRLVGGIATGTARVGTGLAELIPGVDDEAAREVQRDVDEFVADKLAYDPAYDESYVPQLGEVVGEMVPTVLSFALPGGQATAPARIAQLATMIGPAVSEGGMDRAEYEERTGEALSTAERLTAKGADVGLGMLERLGLPTRILKGLPRGFFDRPEASPFLQRIESMVASGLQEGVQEVGQGIARDLTTLAIYDPDRKIADSVMEDFTLGGGAGAVLDLAVGLAQTPLKGRKGRAPKPIEEMTEEEVAEEQELREEEELEEQKRRRQMDRGVIVSGEAPAIAGEIGPQLPEVREDPLDPTLVDSALPVEDMTAQVVKRLGPRLPVGKTFSVGSLDNRFFAEVDGEQYGPAIDDPTVAQELSNRLTATSQQLAKNANIEYIVENSGIEYTEQQGQEVRQLGRFIPSPQDRIISAEDANLATGRDIASVINRQKADRGDAETEVFTLEEVRAANKGDLGNLGDVLAAKDADFLAFRDDPVTPQAPLSPTQPRQPALGRRQQALRTFSSSFDNLISSERAFTDLFASKRMDVSVDSEPFRGLVKRIIGKTPAKQKPLDNLSANERRYLYHRIRKLPSFQEQVTPIPDFSTKTPDADLVRIARRQLEVDRPIDVGPVGRSELGRVRAEARRTAARPIERAEEGVPAGQELVPYDINESALGQQLRDAIKKFGIDDQYATRMVEHVGTAARDSDGNIYIMPIKNRPEGVIAGSAQAGAKVIQVGLDAVMADVNRGASYDQAVAKIMNHEILHALRAMDLFTASEYSLLERLSRKYQKPGEGKTYGQWATDNYGDLLEQGDATRLQEEAIAEMISDALTTGVVMDGDVKKPTGRPRSIFNKIINFFKSLVGVAKNNDVDSFRSLVDSIQSGEVGRRKRGVVRTPLMTDLARKEDPERGITVEDIDLETGRRRRSAARQVKRVGTTGELGDAPSVDQAMFSLRSAVDMFEPSAFDYIGATGRETLDPKRINPARKARHAVVDMPIDMFLGLAQVGEGASKTKGVQDLVERGVKFSELPMLTTRPVGHREKDRQLGLTETALIVTGHEGRHRARALKAAGYDTMPVRIFDDVIRWGEQNDPKSFDYLPYWPETIIAQADINRKTDPSRAGYEPRGLYTYPMFINRDGTVDFQPATEKPSVIFEVAPDPRNTQLLEQWNSLPESDKLQISEEVARAVAPQVLAEVSASGEVVSQVGSYKNETNPSFAVRLSSGDPTDAASALGFVLQQESMMVVSPRPYEGAESRVDPALGTETRSTPAIFIQIGEKSASEVAQIYDTLRNADGAPEFSGQSTIDGNMMILLDGSPDVEAAIEAFDRALNRQYAIDDTVVFSSFPQAKDYNYETEVLNTRVSPEGARRRLNNVRAAVQAGIRERVSEARDSGDRRSNRGVLLERLSGAIRPNGRLSLTHYSRTPIQRTDPDRAGTGADRTRRYAPKGTYFGITEADVNPYRRESMLGVVENRFEVDPEDLYDIDQDPENLLKLNADRSWDWDGTLSGIKQSGKIGLFTDNPRIGKVAFITEPLEAVTGKAETKPIETELIAPRQTVTPQQADEAVDKNIASIAEDVKGVPRFSVKASPEAQYVAQNPDSALKPDEPMFSVRGDIPAVDKLTKGPDREEPNGRVFMRATGTGALGTFFTKLKQGALDRYAPLAKYYQNIPELRELEADSSAIAAALFSDRSKGILASAVKYGVPVYRGGLTRVEEFTHDGETYRGLIGVMSLIYNKDVGDLRKIAQAYAMVQRGDYLKGKNKLTPVDAKSRKEVLDAVDALTDADGYNPVKKWHDVWSAYNNRTIDFLKATGILNDETADVWKGSSYIPFYRTGASEDALPKVAKGVFGDLTRMSEFRAYQGSDKAVDVGIVESVVLNLSAAIEMGMKNVAQQRITRDMQKMGLARQIKAKGAVPKGVNAIDFKVNGNRVRFEIDDNLIFDSMNMVGTGYAEQAAIKYLGAPANVLRELVTRDPGFMMANMMRDTLSTWTTSGASFVPVLDTVKGLGDGIERLEKLGVVGGYDFSIDKADIVKFYEAENKRRTESMTPLNMFSRLWNWSGRATTASDAATRNAVYNDVLARTGNEAEAAFQAMEIINFSRRGANPIVRVIAAAIPFLNARFQGLDVFMRAALGNYTTRREESPAKGQLRLAYRGSLLAGLTALYYLLVSDEDWYKEQDEHTREMNWLVPTDSGVPFRLPIPFEVGLLFKTIPEAIMANYMGNQSDRELRQTLQRGVVSTLEVNPLAIQAVGPLLEAYLNYNSFTGRPIVPFYVGKMTPGLAGGVYSTQLATDIGEALNINPLKIDHVVSGYTGTIGSYVISLADALYKEAFDRGVDRPAKTIFEYPLIKRFFAQKEGGGLRADAYDLINDVKEVVATISTLQKEGRREELEAYIAARSHIIALKDAAYTMEKVISRVRREQRAITSSDMDPEIKRQMIEDLDANLNEYLKVVPRLKQMADAPFIQGTY